MNPVSMKTARIIGLSEILFAAGIVLFWVGFFAQGPADFFDARFQEIYLAFETSFPAADGLLTFVLLCAGIGLWRRSPSGWFFSIVAGSMLIFLGTLDFAFNIRQGIYHLPPGDAVLNLSLNGICLAGGVFYIWSAWKFGFKGVPKNA
jgi:hypothetical protein